MARGQTRNSKHGVSLVEEICAVCILVIGVIASLSLVSAGRTSILSDDTQEGAAAATQKLTDTLIAYLSKKSTMPTSAQLAADISGAAYCGSSQANFSPTGAKRQYILTDQWDGSELVGYRITSRAYYNGGKNCVQMNGFASAMADCYLGGAIPTTPPPVVPEYPPSGPESGVPFLLYGTKYRNNQVADKVDTPVFKEGDYTSAYPVVFGPIMHNESGKQSRNLSAPSLFFLGGNGGSSKRLQDVSSIYADSASQVANLKTNFVYIASEALTYKRNNDDKGDDPQINLSPLDSSNAYIYFAQDCQIIQTDSLDKDYNSISPDMVVKKYSAGLYTFTRSQNLWSKGCVLTPVTDGVKSVLQTYSADYIVSTWQKKNLVSGEYAANAPSTPQKQYPYTYNGAANWTQNGVLQSGDQLRMQQRGDPNPSNQTGKDVYMYVNNYSSWGSDAQTYKANRIAMQIINSKTTLQLPENKTVTMQAGTVTLNIQSGDGDPAKFSTAMVLKQSAGSKFVVTASSLVLYHDLTVESSDGTVLYRASAGMHNIKGGSVDLLSADSAKNAFLGS